MTGRATAHAVPPGPQGSPGPHGSPGATGTSAEGAASSPAARESSSGAADSSAAVADAGSGKRAILLAARRAFMRNPYAEVTIRGIAADAGVSPSLVVKHFGRKDELFNAVADFGPEADAIFDAPLDRLGRHMVLTLVRRRRAYGSDPFLRVVFSLGNRDERVLLRDRFHEQVTRRLAARLPGPDGTLRAELVAGQLIGLGAALSLHSEGEGPRTTPERLADLYAPALQTLLTEAGAEAGAEGDQPGYVS
ncbi:TetR family transcriptional regulator [Streptomyces sp. NPDC060198]|uniref:TetR/AcrR family transcriptional regulator n=1 Tax=Streptomyces sp. NPDC060198 TaxID=3347070 RepID=UPI00364EA453